MNCNQYSVLAISILLVVLPTGPTSHAHVMGRDEFDSKIRPILLRHCTACHGPDESNREAHLRLDTFTGATADLGGYAAIVPGDIVASELIARVSSDEDPMPPAGHARLEPSEIDALRSWIESGAAYTTHWAFLPPKKIEPVVDPNDQWSIGTVDRWVLQKLRNKGLLPNNLATPDRLIRRLALDLTGLPPTQETVDSYAANPTMENYESIVDQYLADQAYGERWASMWLDLARYADSVGYAGDEPRTIWPWRDWLIRALNDNKPLDRFTTEILAGDLLDDSTVDQKLATAFHRNTLNNNEGGTNDEEFRMIAVKDRASTTASSWLGLTMRCAECHSHKYDPISHLEYHQFLDFFNHTADADRPDETPVQAVDSLDNGEPVLVPVLESVALEQQRTTHIMKRGNFRNLGDAVSAATPFFLHAWPGDQPRNRLGLAHWIVANENPLTARVMVNRYWARLFGRGIVETEEDFGTQGSLPANQPLLDWLAVDLREHGWDSKRLLKQLVVSSTYMQSADASSEQFATDPHNLWLSRGPGNRLDAEMLRDQALSIAGLLCRKMYGPPVFPPNPIRSVTNAFKGAEIWNVSTGEDRYRRAIYTYLKRSQPHPLFDTFDVSMRDVCCLRRIGSNTPLQSFMTLNDETFVEAAQVLALEMESGETVDRQIAIAWKRALFRDAAESEMRPLIGLYQQSLKTFEADLGAARQLAGTAGQETDDAGWAGRAALVVVANVVLNLDAVLTK